MANLCDIRNYLNKFAVDALPYIFRFGRPAILLGVIRLPLKELSGRFLLSRPDMASARTYCREFHLSFQLVLWQVLYRSIKNAKKLVFKYAWCREVVNFTSPSAGTAMVAQNEVGVPG